MTKKGDGTFPTPYLSYASTWLTKIKKKQESIPSGFSGWYMTEVDYNVQTHQTLRIQTPQKWRY